MSALHVADPPTGEAEVGMEGFATSTQGVGGRLRARPEDFVVVEESLPPPEVPGGRVTAATFRLTNWETNRFVRQMSRRLGISHRKVRFAGVKDKRAITTQLMTVETPAESVRALRMTDVELLDARSSDHHIGLGDLVANAFEITITGIDLVPEELDQRVERTVEEARGAGGFPNYYGHQRFGTARPVSHLVGRELVRGDVEGAVWTYLTREGAREDEEARAARKGLRDTNDVRQALREFPKNLGNERNMLEHLLHDPRDWEGAFRRMPFNLQLMMVHAYQGLVFNRVLSERMRRDLPLAKPVEGDVLAPLDERSNPVTDRAVEVTSRNLAKAERQVERGRALVTGLVPGTDVPVASGEMGEVEATVMEGMGLSPGDFSIVVLTDLSSTGIRRPLAITEGWPEWTANDGALTLSFRLQKGCYATCVLREVMKAHISCY
jgi:tRNA pseudouridine13 synthase